MMEAYLAWLSEPLDVRQTVLANIGRAKAIGDDAIEKDYWVSVVLRAIFSLSYGDHFVFKGGTSLSKGWNLIQRFSEDIDLAVDREYLGFPEVLTKKQRTKLRKQSKIFIEESLAVDLSLKLREYGLESECQVVVPETHESDLDPVVLLVKYNSIVENRPLAAYMLEQIKVEISCRSMLEPYQKVSMRSMVADAYPNEPFAESCFEVQTVMPGRTFLEKIFLLHEEFTRPGGCSRCDRLTRHLYDIEKMMDECFAIEAMNNEALYNDIVRHRKAFNAWSGLDYHTHAPFTITFLPPSNIYEILKNDYSLMQQGFIHGDSLSFDDLLKRISKLQERFRKLSINFNIG